MIFFLLRLFCAVFLPFSVLCISRNNNRPILRIDGRVTYQKIKPFLDQTLCENRGPQNKLNEMGFFCSGIYSFHCACNFACPRCHSSVIFCHVRFFGATAQGRRACLAGSRPDARLCQETSGKRWSYCCHLCQTAVNQQSRGLAAGCARKCRKTAQGSRVDAAMTTSRGSPFWKSGFFFTNKPKLHHEE